MGRRLKRGQAGNAVQYLTRNQCLKKLQLRLSEFRRLCILKGIHPRDPRKKTQGNTKTYYHVKDINYLAHEPLLNKFRDIHAYEKKIKKARAKKNPELAERLQKRRPTFRLDHLVKERYPTFSDALRDLDDALTLVHLFATLPAEQSVGIPRAAVALASRLALEWQAYVVRTHALRAAFVAVKGFYYQAEVQGQKITWLVPHQLSQMLPQDVDFRVMLTFLDFHNTLLQFVNFKLYHALGMRYPPVLDPRLEKASQGLAALMQGLASAGPSVPALEGSAPMMTPELEKRLKTLPDRLQETLAATPADNDQAAQQSAPTAEGPHSTGQEAAGQDSGPRPSRDEAGNDGPPSYDDVAAADALEQARGEDGAHPPAQGMDLDRQGGAESPADDDAETCGNLFSGLLFFLGREVPREQLLLVIRAFGGSVAWDGDGSPTTENDEAITHQVVDRPTQGHRFLSREYVQPQWVFDSANFRVLADAALYAPGAPPPPHPSPFALDDPDAYVPDYAATLRRMQESARASRAREEGALAEAEFREQADGEVVDPDAETTRKRKAAEAAYAKELAKELGAGESMKTEALPEKDQQALPLDDEDDLAANLLPRKQRQMYGRVKAVAQAKKARGQELERRKKKLQEAT